MQIEIPDIPAEVQGVFVLILVLLAFSVLITDTWKKSIYNLQTYTAALLGCMLWFLYAGVEGLCVSLLGATLGFSLLFPFYLMGGMGAGDVKYMAAIGALMGWYFVIITMYYTALFGGIMAFAIIIWKGCFWETLKSTISLVRHFGKIKKRTNQPLYLPYGVAISLGSLMAIYSIQ